MTISYATKMLSLTSGIGVLRLGGGPAQRRCGSPFVASESKGSKRTSVRYAIGIVCQNLDRLIEYLKHVALNQIFVRLVGESSHLTLVTPPSLALSVFRMAPSGLDLSSEELNELNQALYKRISSHKDILLTHTNLNGVYCIRFVVGGLRTTRQHIEKAFELINEEAEVTLRLWDAGAE